MLSKKLTSSEKEIIRIFRDARSKISDHGFNLSKRQISREFLRSPVVREASGKEKLEQVQDMEKQRRLDRSVDRMKKTIEDIKAKRQASPWQEKGRNFGERYNAGDWRKRLGVRSSVGGTYGKQQDLLRSNLKSLVKKGYLEGTGFSSNVGYKPTKKLLEEDIDKR